MGRALTVILVLIALLGTSETQAAPDKRDPPDNGGTGEAPTTAKEDAGAEPTAKRSPPDYAGRPSPAPTVGESLLWVPRVVFSPIWFTTEFLLRRPLGALEVAAERANLPETLYDFFTFGPDHKAGWAPVAFVDFGINPSIGVYAFWDDAFFSGNDLRVHFVAWPDAWLGGSFVDRVRLPNGATVALRFEGSRRPDYPFYGLGPRSIESAQSRYGADRIGGNISVDFPFWRASKFELGAGVRYVTFYDGHYLHDPGIVESANALLFGLPPGFPGGYAAEVNRAGVAVDSRRPFPYSGSGFRLEASAEEDNGFRPIQSSAWIRYEAGAGGFLDLDGHRRVLSLSGLATFADPFGSVPVPFTELATLGGDKAPMPGFLPGRMIDRSAAVATLRYTWPIAAWVSGSMQVAVGNVFGRHLEDFEARLLRFSAALGLQTDGSPDSSFQFLFGIGTETFDQGGKVDSFRLAIGTTTGL